METAVSVMSTIAPYIAPMAGATSAALSAASSALSIYSAVKGGPRVPGVPGATRSPADEAAARAEALSSRTRVGRQATMLTAGLGISSPTTGAVQPPKALLGV